MNKTAYDAGWRVSRYNLIARIPGTEKAAIANLYKGTCGVYTPIELYLLDELETLAEDHPILPRFRERGLIVNFDERAALEAMGRMGGLGGVGLTICPTMGCNFDCPYCFENHKSGIMKPEVQGDIVNLAARMLDSAGVKMLHVTWFGGEPLLAPQVIESLSARFMTLCEERHAGYHAGIITNGYLLTQEIADMLGNAKVETAQITLDGIGEKHDRTRHLAGGGPTFARITENLRTLKLPFPISLRHNVHAENRDEIAPLQAFVEQLARESGNRITYYPALVSSNAAADCREENVSLLCDSQAGEIGIAREAKRFMAGRGQFCLAHHLLGLGIDEKGRLQKCWEDVDKPEHSFGIAARWDPKDPVNTADQPDNLTRYFNTAMPNGDEECRECVWLPACVGGCPNKRLYYQRQCLPFKNEPEKYVLALYERMEKERQKPSERKAENHDKERIL